MTDKLRAAAEAALEALESHTAIKHPQQIRYRDSAIEQLRAALAEPTGKQDLQVAEPVEIGPEWTPCVKRPVTVHVRSQRVNETHISTREGITPVQADDLIMRGVDGEEYPIGRDLFNRTYFVGVARIKQQEAEPVAWLYTNVQSGDVEASTDPDWSEYERELWHSQPLYTAPPRREWKSLTDEEREQFSAWMHPDVLARIEAALKEKNHDTR